jgi:hypothetical protein
VAILFFRSRAAKRLGFVESRVESSKEVERKWAC